MPKFLIIFLLCAWQIKAQKNSIALQKAFEQGERLLISYKNDSAEAMFKYVIETSEKQNDINNKLFFNALQRLARVQEQKEQYEVAMKTILRAIDLTEKNKVYDALSRSYITMALLQEKMGNYAHCNVSLNKAAQIIDTHQLDSLRAYYCVRKSSYFRMTGKLDSALILAEEGIKWSEQYKMTHDAVSGYMLLGALHVNSAPQKALQYYNKAAIYCGIESDFFGQSAMMNAMAKIHLRNNRIDSALYYNDSCFVVLRHENYHNKWILGSANLTRAQIFKSTNQLDSALYRTEIGYKLMLELEVSRKVIQATEIEARFNDEKKVLLIEEQSQKLVYEGKQRFLLWIFVGSLAIFISILVYLNNKLKKISLQKAEQATIIANKNEALEISLEQQQILLGEVHHRVKNNLQIIISLLDLQAEELEDKAMQQKLSLMANRIYSIASVHELMYHKIGAEYVDFHTYIQTLLTHASQSLGIEGGLNIELNISEVHFNMDTLIPLGIVLNELLTNSVKYASENRHLKIIIKLEKEDKNYLLYYKDNGPGLPSDKKTGMGSYLLQSMSRQLNGSCKSYNEHGAVFEIRFQEKNSAKHV